MKPAPANSAAVEIAPNLTAVRRGDKLILETDLSQNIGMSESGKSTMITKTSGARGQQKVILNGVEHTVSVMIYRTEAKARATVASL